MSLERCLCRWWKRIVWRKGKKSNKDFLLSLGSIKEPPGESPGGSISTKTNKRWIWTFFSGCLWEGNISMFTHLHIPKKAGRKFSFSLILCSNKWLLGLRLFMLCWPRVKGDFETKRCKVNKHINNASILQREESSFISSRDKRNIEWNLWDGKKCIGMNAAEWIIPNISAYGPMQPSRAAPKTPSP